MSPWSQQWVHLGNVLDYYFQGDGAVAHNDEIAGPVHLEGYAFLNYDGKVDLYVRATFSRPTMRFAHYKLDVQDPAEFWRARHYMFMGRIDRPEWATPRSRLYLSAMRLRTCIVNSIPQHVDKTKSEQMVSSRDARF